MREKEKNMAKKNYYAVKQGKVPGIYRTWDACKAQVHGYPGAIYKGFERLEEAEAFLGGGKRPEPLLRETKGTYSAAPERKAVQSTAAPDPSSWDWEHLILAEKPCEDPEYAGVGRSAVAYVDGSYQHALGKFSCGVVLFLDGKELNLAEEYSDPDLVSMRNVASITITRESQAGVRENGRRKNREPSITGIFTIWHRPKLRSASAK